MTVPNDGAFDQSCHLSFRHLAVDHPAEPTTIKVHIKASKMDPFRKGVDIFLGRTGSDLCPVRALFNYLCARGSSQGPLFVFADKKLLSHSRFVDRLRTGLREAGIDRTVYCSHKFRFGAATTALGRWESSAYLQYVRLSRDQLVGVSNILAAP